MRYEKPNDLAIEKLAWVIAEEFVETYHLLDSLDRAEPSWRFELRRSQLHQHTLQLAWQA